MPSGVLEAMHPTVVIATAIAVRVAVRPGNLVRTGAVPEGVVARAAILPAVADCWLAVVLDYVSERLTRVSGAPGSPAVDALAGRGMPVRGRALCLVDVVAVFARAVGARTGLGIDATPVT